MLMMCTVEILSVPMVCKLRDNYAQVYQYISVKLGFSDFFFTFFGTVPIPVQLGKIASFSVQLRINFGFGNDTQNRSRFYSEKSHWVR